MDMQSPPERGRPAPGRLFTRQQVEARNNMNSAAIIIDNLVYDVTEFLEEHPGGAEVLLDNAGRDASRCFRDVGHSELALEWRAHFLAGELVPADRWPVEPRAPPAPPAPADALTLPALLNVWGPPAVLALLAATLYVYMF